VSNNSRPTLRNQDEDQLGRENASNLWKLRNGWGEVYTITVTFPNDWTAARIGEPQTVLKATSAAHLREDMIADHQARPLPRRPSLRVGDDA
jgi:hypothetical protein